MKESEIPKDAVVLTCLGGVVGLLRNPQHVPVFCIDYDTDDEAGENDLDNDGGLCIIIPLDNPPSNTMFELKEVLRQLVNYNDADPNLYDGDDDNTLGLIMGRARHALLKASRGE